MTEKDEARRADVVIRKFMGKLRDALNGDQYDMQLTVRHSQFLLESAAQRVALLIQRGHPDVVSDPRDSVAPLEEDTTHPDGGNGHGEWSPTEVPPVPDLL